MSKTINGIFETRRDAEMAVERLVQEFEVERTDIFVVARGVDNSVGPTRAGSDNESAQPGPEARQDRAHEGAIVVSIDVNDDKIIDKVADAFEEFGGKAESEQ